MNKIDLKEAHEDGAQGKFIIIGEILMNIPLYDILKRDKYVFM